MSLENSIGLDYVINDAEVYANSTTLPNGLWGLHIINALMCMPLPFASSYPALYALTQDGENGSKSPMLTYSKVTLYVAGLAMDHL